MRFYAGQHKYYVGIDLHARKMYVCVLDAAGEVQMHRNMTASPTGLGRVISRFGPDLVIAVECIFTWYWIADYCAKRKVPFVLGHALYMRAVHGVKTKNDKIDSQKIATMLRGGMLPQAYAYPNEKRATRDLLRRRQYFMHHRSELLTHLQNTNTQYNLGAYEKRIGHACNREGIAERFTDPMVKKSIEADLRMLEAYDELLKDLEDEIERQARYHDKKTLELLRSIPGVGKILALLMLYEIDDITRFPTVGQFISYSRLVKCAHESAGKRTSGGHDKIGNPHLKWAFSEGAVLLLKGNDRAKRLLEKLTKRHGKAKALSIIAQKLGRTVYYMLKRGEAFDAERFFGDGMGKSDA